MALKKTQTGCPRFPISVFQRVDFPQPAFTLDAETILKGLRAFVPKKQKVAQHLVAESLEDEASPHQETVEKAPAEADAME